jgi:hypothetical protein
MKYKVCTVVATITTLALPGVAGAASLGWFDEMPARDSLGRIRAPFSFSGSETRLTFGVEAYKSLVEPYAQDDYPYLAASDQTVVKIYGEFADRVGDFRAPLAALNPQASADETSLLGSSSSRLSGFGVKWQHRVDAVNTVALSAGYSEIPLSANTPSVDALDTRAALSWHGSWAGTFLQPGVSGSVFVGDKSARDEAYQQLGRRYYGFSVGGELRVAQDHVPYFSYRLRRNFYNPEDPAYLIAPYEDRSQISAGWRWQVRPNWSLQAEARYGLNGANLDPYSPDRSRFFFGTRFDFR